MAGQIRTFIGSVFDPGLERGSKSKSQILPECAGVPHKVVVVCVYIHTYDYNVYNIA